jgi:hypothetical protein
MMMVRIPARSAAMDFSFKPPIGKTNPRNVTSPVMATSLLTGRFSRVPDAARSVPQSARSASTPP